MTKVPKRTSEEIKKIESESWKGISEFDLNHDSFEDIYFDKWNQFLLEESIKDLNLSTMRIINVGGGNGKEAEFLIKKGAKNVLLVDIAPGQVESAKLRKKKHSLTNLDLEVGDAEFLSGHKDRDFDLGYVYMALHHFPNHERSISELCRVSTEILFVDIMDAWLTKFMNLFGFYREEWCGIEPNRLNERVIRNILAEKEMDMEIEYFFVPPYYGNNKIIFFFINLIQKVINNLISIRAISLIFGNVCIIKGF